MKSVCLTRAVTAAQDVPLRCFWELVIWVPTKIVFCYVLAPSRLGCRPQSNLRQHHNWGSDPNPRNDALVIKTAPEIH